MRLWQLLGALVLVPPYSGVDSRLINSISTMTVNQWNDNHPRTLLTQTVNANMIYSLGSVTGIPILSQTTAEAIAVPTRAEPNHAPLANIDVPFNSDHSNLDNGSGKATSIDEEIGSLLFRKGLELAAPLVAFFFTLAIRLYRPPQEPDSFWTITNLIASVAMLPFHDPSFSDILGDVVRSVAVASNVLHYQATLGKKFRSAIVLVITIVVYFLLYSQRSNIIPEGPEDKGLRAVAPWICAPLAIVIVSELLKFLQWLKLNCLAILERIRHVIADR
jgi:hypothetical protein